MIRLTTRALLIAGAALFVLPAAAQTTAQPGTPQTATTQAQSQADASATGTGDVVVTARRREETLLSVPIAITAFTAARLERAGAIDLTDLQNVTPNTTLKDARGTNSTLSAFIRGVGQQDPVPGFESGIGIYLDDVYLNRPQAAVLDIYDVDRIEVLRGPQGTLYGRNTIGGAIKYVTRRLNPDAVSVSARGTYGSYHQADGIVTASAPLGSWLRVGVAGARLTRDGFGENRNLGIDNYNKNVTAFRGTIEAETPDSRLFVRLTGDYTHDRSNPRNGHRVFAGYLTGSPVLANVYDTNAGLNFPRQDVQAGGGSMSVTAKLTDMLTFRSISAYREDRSFTPIDFDSTPSVDVDVPAVYRNNQTSQEFQLLVNSPRLNGLVGFYYLGAKATTRFDVLLGTTLANLNAGTQGDVRTETSSVYADFTYDFTSQLSLSLGGRYTWDQRKSFVFKQNYLGGSTLGSTFTGMPTAFGAAATNFRGQANFRRFTPRASLSYKPTTDHLLYASYSEGFKGGGFDPRGSATQAPDTDGTPGIGYQDIYNYLRFRPESVRSYEVGYKGALFDRRLTIAADAFTSDYSDVQVPGSAACVVNGLANFCGITTNAAKARIRGAELETTAILARGFAGAGSTISFNGTLGYLDARYRNFAGSVTAGAAPTNIAQYRVFQNTPDWTLSGTLATQVPVGDGSVSLSGGASYRSLTHQFEVASPFLDQPGYTLYDAHLVYTFGSQGRFSIGVHGKNLSDVRYKIGGYQYVAADVAGNPTVIPATGRYVPTLGKEGIATVFYGNPRQVFGTLSVRF
ncbi:TonB-dependent receptor [Sphingomonas sp.]|uniref:TonB-dependent receptor n=1 Tax=Sphingomonas sp. TaxID=28214 RepID=UPI003CC60DA5